MIELHYGVVRIDGRWSIIAPGLKVGSYATEAEAEAVARHMAELAGDLPVHLHIQSETGELHHEQRPG